MSDYRKVIYCITISPLELSEYDVNKTNVRIKELGNTIKGITSDYINAISENNIQRPDMGKYYIISQLSFSFKIESNKIEDINEEFYSDGKMPDYYQALSNDAESK